jgi:hypothetical protein
MVNELRIEYSLAPIFQHRGKTNKRTKIFDKLLLTHGFYFFTRQFLFLKKVKTLENILYLTIGKSLPTENSRPAKERKLGIFT